MRKLDVAHDALKFFEDLQAKQYRQIGTKMFALLSDPKTADCGPVKGYDNYWRVDFGEYRIAYRYDETTVYVLAIGKRNDDEIYKKLERK